jgi:DNA-binding CsgD family transcriptional regulator
MTTDNRNAPRAAAGGAPVPPSRGALASPSRVRARLVRFDVISAIEACYTPISDERGWLEHLLEAIDGLDEGHGLYAFSASADPHEIHRDLTFAERGAIPDAWVASAVSMAADPQAAEIARALYVPVPPVDLASRRHARIPEHCRDTAQRYFSRVGDIDEAIGLVAADASGRAVFLGAPGRRGMRLPPRTAAHLRRFAAHLTSAVRLRAALRDPAVRAVDRADAVLDPSGRVHHAAGGAEPAAVRQALAEAVRRREMARGSVRRTSPEEALSLWQGLVRGEWTLVDHCDANDRRLILARRNDPALPDPKALGRRERAVLAFAAMGHSNKYVAYLLGLAPATVAAYLARGCAKLGIRSRRELIALFAPARASSAPPAAAAPTAPAGSAPSARSTPAGPSPPPPAGRCPPAPPSAAPPARPAAG